MDSENEYSDSKSDTFDNDKDERDFVLFGKKRVQHIKKQTNRVFPCQSRTTEISDASAGKRKLNVTLPPLEDHRQENNARFTKSAPLPSISLKVEEDKLGQNTTEINSCTAHGVQPRVLSCKQAFEIIVLRMLMILHNLLIIWRVTVEKKNRIYLVLMITVGCQILEGLYSLLRDRRIRKR